MTGCLDVVGMGYEVVGWFVSFGRERLVLLLLRVGLHFVVGNSITCCACALNR